MCFDTHGSKPLSKGHSVSQERVERRLAAVLAADVAGYSRLMGINEEGTLARLKAIRKAIVDPVIASHRGRIVKTTGDGVLVEFASAVDAVRSAVEIQRGMTKQNAAVRQDERIEFRIGIHVGDIIIDDDDIFGDGVNIAARFEGIAEPGGLCMSNDAYRQVRGKVEIVCDDLGPQHLKNIAEPMHAWRVRLTGQTASAVQSGSTESEPQPLPLPEKPSIAVLPFQNMSGDPDQEYFADGMVEEIITALSRFKSLFVIARNSSFTFKGRAVDIKEVGHKLGVRYVLEGSVRKASGKVRITGQLIDALTGTHIWADKFERDLTDVFALQDEVAASVVSAIQPKLLQTEIAFAMRRRAENFSAYDLYLRALQQFNLSSRDEVAEALRLADQALELEPRFGSVAALAGICRMQRVLFGYAIDPEFERKEAVRLLHLALSVDDSDPETLANAALVSAFMVGDCESEMVDRAVALNPNSFLAWHCRGWVYRIAGHLEEALCSFERAARMSPVDTRQHLTFAAMGGAFIELRRFDEAIIAANKARRQSPSYSSSYRCLASAFAHLGRDTEAREAAARLLETDPSFTITTWVARGGQSNSKLLIEGLRKAGLPE
jgi:adenylate cyclase